MKIIKNIAKLGLILSLAFSYGCASINSASPEMDAAAKEFKSDDSVAQVYVYRNETFGAAISMPVTVNGKLAGTTGPNSFFKFDLPAGAHTFTSQGDKSTLSLDAEAGKIYYIWQEVKMGALSAGSKLQLVNEKEGQDGVNECKLIQSNI